MDPRQRVEMIRARAYELWELRGRPEGCESEHWLEAEGEFRAAESEEAARRRHEPTSQPSAGEAASPGPQARSGHGNGHGPANGNGAQHVGWLGWIPDWLRERAADLESAAQKLARGRGVR